jgi:hypothetical protein
MFSLPKAAQRTVTALRVFAARPIVLLRSGRAAMRSLRTGLVEYSIEFRSDVSVRTTAGQVTGALCAVIGFALLAVWFAFVVAGVCLIAFSTWVEFRDES